MGTPCLVTMYPNGRNILHNKIISSWDNVKLKEKTTVQNKCSSLMSSAPCFLLKFFFSYAVLNCNFYFFSLSLLDLMKIQPPSGLGNIPFSRAVNSVVLTWRLESWDSCCPKVFVLGQKLQLHLAPFLMGCDLLSRIDVYWNWHLLVLIPQAGIWKFRTERSVSPPAVPAAGAAVWKGAVLASWGVKLGWLKELICCLTVI